MNTGVRIRTERRLAAILAADIAGYSRLIGAEEESTLQRLRSVRAEEITGIGLTHRIRRRCHRRKPGRKAVPKFRPGVSAAFRTAEKPSTRYPGIKHPITLTAD